MNWVFVEWLSDKTGRIPLRTKVTDKNEESSDTVLATVLPSVNM